MAKKFSRDFSAFFITSSRVDHKKYKEKSSTTVAFLVARAKISCPMGWIGLAI